MTREGIQTDHKFEPSPYCDCNACSENCFYHYGEDDVCMRERYEHVKSPTLSQNEK